MMYEPIEPGHWHPAGCDCADSDPRPFWPRLNPIDRWSLYTIAGLVLGSLSVMVLDVTGWGPRLFHALGLL